MMYFGNPFSPDQQNPKETWNNGYEAVYHLNGNPTNPIIDSTGNYNGTAYTGNSIMASSNSVGGVIGNGIFFNGNSNITLGNVNSNSWTGLTIEVWANLVTKGTTTSIVTKQDSSNNIWTLGTKLNSKFSANLQTDCTGGTSFSSGSYGTVSTNTWFSLSFTWSVSSPLLTYYINGAVSGTPTSVTGTSILDSSLKASIGSNFQCFKNSKLAF